MGLFATIKHVFNRKLEAAKEEKPVQRKLFSKFEIGVGSKLSIDVSDYALVYQSAYFKEPSFEDIVQKIGVVDIAGSTVYRFYMAKYMFQVVESETGEVEECRLFVAPVHYFPGTPSDWALYLEKDRGYLGAPQITYDEVVYDRIWSDSVNGWVRPLRMIERVYNDEGRVIKEITYDSMMYGSWLHKESDTAQYVLMSSVTDGGDYISFWAAIDVPIMAVQKIY